MPIQPFHLLGNREPIGGDLVVRFLDSAIFGLSRALLCLKRAGLRRGLNQSSYVEGRNLVIEYRWAGNQADRLPALAADLVQLRVAVIVSPGTVSTLAAKAATTSIPIVFGIANDPVRPQPPPAPA